MKNKNVVLERIPFLGWIILPILGVFMATNYILGLTRKPTWAIIDQIPQNPTENITRNLYNPDNSEFNWDGEGLITFWFDDAWASQYKVAFPRLNEYGFKGALAVPTTAIGWDKYMTWAQVKRLAYNGWEITSHSKSHECDLTKLDQNAVESELVGSQMELLEKGYQTFIYVTPCGASNADLIGKAKNHYTALRTTEEGLNPIPVNDTYSLKLYEVGNKTTLAEVQQWISDAKLQKQWLIIMFHEFDTSGLDYTAAPTLFDSIVSEVVKSEIQVVIPSQVLNIQEQKL